MADKIEDQLAEGLEQDLGIRAMAEKLAPRGVTASDREATIAFANQIGANAAARSLSHQGTVEHKLQEIERLVREIRAMAAQVKGMLG